MGNKELLRAKVMEMVREGQLTLRQAAGRLKRSQRSPLASWRMKWQT